MLLFLGIAAIAVAVCMAILLVARPKGRAFRRGRAQEGDSVERGNGVVQALRQGFPTPSLSLGGGNPPLKSYVYVSDVKVDMLYEQLNEARRRELTHELKLDAKVLSYSISVSPAPTATRYARVAAVVRELETQNLIGSTETPLLYFRGQLSMKTGRYPVEPDGPRDVVFFVGEETNGFVIVLGGTAHHLIGSVGKPPWSNSGITELMRALVHATDAGDVGLDQYAGAWDAEARLVWREETTPTQIVEFVAVKLAQSKRGLNMMHYDVLLGSPVYVALVEDESN